MADWTEVYRPKTLSEVRGNDSARDELAEWARSWSDHREAAILHGSPGVGKTSAAHALAADLGWDVVELNASDQRTADVIERIAGRASQNESLAAAFDRASGVEGSGPEADRQLVILDEADSIHHQKDYGGQSALVDVIKSADQPIVLIANDLYEMSAGLRNAGRQIEFRDVSARSILPVLRDICRQEGVEYEDEALEAIAEANSGDLRGAINDLQAVAEGDQTLTADDVATSGRDRTENIWSFLDAVLKESSAEEALRSAYDTDETPDSLVQWVEDKANMIYEPEELSRAYVFLANADKWLGRVRATQNYSYWRYATDNLSAGVAASRDHTRGGWTRYGGPPFRSASNKTRDHVARQVAERSGTSVATARRWILPYLAAMTHHCSNRELTVAMTAAYDLDAEHVAFVTGSGESTNKVQGIVEEAEERQQTATVEASGGAFEGASRTTFGGAEWEEEDDGEGDDVEFEAREEPEEGDDGQANFSDFT